MGYTVLNVAYPLTEVGENAVGGSEQVLTLLDRELTEAGHHSVVIAAEGSRVRGTLIASPRANGALDEKVRRWGQRTHKRIIREALEQFPVDLIHMHSLDFHQYLAEPGTPTLATLHLPPNWYPPSIFRLRRKHFYLNCVSLSQERGCPPSRSLLPYIANGVDVDRLQGRARKRDFALALGRICPEKGFHVALDAARRAGMDLILGGEVFPYAAHQEYFRKKIVPRLDKRRQFVGPLGFQEKKRLLQEARCLLVPSTVEETSSLVAMEALAAGTPVIAFPSGALPEIVEHGKTGYLVSNVKEMVKGIAAVDKLDTEECTRTARRRFSAEGMVERYVRAYERIVIEKRGRERVLTTSATSWLVG